MFEVKSLLKKKNLISLERKKIMFKTDQNSFQNFSINSRKTVIVESRCEPDQSLSKTPQF